MDKKISATLVVILMVVLVVLGACAIMEQGKNKDSGIVGVYNISEYHQFTFADGEFVKYNTGDGEYDGEIIEITSYENGIFEGYCSLPSVENKFPILGIYNEKNGMIQCICNCDDLWSGLYDWAHGFIKDGIMHLSGITFGSDSEFYGSFQFTFVKEGSEEKPVTVDSMFNTGDKYKSFAMFESLDETEIESIYNVSFEVKDDSNGLCYMKIIMPGSYESVDFVGSVIDDNIMIGVGYDDETPFSLMISLQGKYVQINREYTSSGDKSATWTAYLTTNGEPVDIRKAPDFNGISSSGTAFFKDYGKQIQSSDIKFSLDTVTNSLFKLTTDDKYINYGNMVPCSDGYVILLSSSHAEYPNFSFFLGFLFIDKDLKVMEYTGLSVSNNNVVNAMTFKGVI